MSSFTKHNKSRRPKTHRRWTNSEILSILKYIKVEKNFEKPTAQVYYTKLLQKTKVNTTWDLIRWKMRYLRHTFKKANDWIKSTDAELLKSCKGLPCVQEKLKKICPYYDVLFELFGEDSPGVCYEIYDLDTSSSANPSPANETLTAKDYEDSKPDINCTLNLSEPILSETNNFNNISETPIASSVFSIEEAFGTNHQHNGNFQVRKSQDSKSKLIDTRHIENYDVQTSKLNFKINKFNKNVELKEKKLYLKEMKILEQIERRKDEVNLRKQELDLKRMEIEKDERLRVLEIEAQKQERITKFELEMKYKYSK